MNFKKKKVKRVNSNPNLLPPPYIWDVFDFPNGLKTLVTEIEADSEREAERDYKKGKFSARACMYKPEFQVNLKKTKEKLEEIEKEKQRRIQGLWYNRD